VMPLELFEALLRSLHSESFTVEEFEYCGRGEPLTHKQFREFPRLVRQFFPKSRQRVITSGNFDYSRCLGDTAMEEIVVSCDGFYQSNYEKYRIGGNVTKVLQFLSDIPKEVDGQRQLIIWKYILFEFNDSDHEIRDAQNKAAELDVDILFVFTHSRFRSKRFTLENRELLPRYRPNVRIDATPFHYRLSKTLSPLEMNGWPASSPDSTCMCAIEEVKVAEGWLHLHGWVLSTVDISAVRIFRNSLPMGEATIGVPRPDVYRVFPEWGEFSSGFSLECQGLAPADVETIEATIIGPGDKELATFSRRFSDKIERPPPVLDLSVWPANTRSSGQGDGSAALLHDKPAIRTARLRPSCGLTLRQS
jgi:hypothetical protein